MIKSGAIFLFMIFLTGLASASLGITPAKQEINFIAGQKYEFTFTIISDLPDKDIELYLDGDLAEYGRLSKTKAIGTESFNVYVNLPDESISPGPHSIIVRGKEALPETDFIGTRIDIGAPIKIFVPYPGRYAELYLTIPHGNIDERIPVELLAINRGKEDLLLDPVYVDFYTNGIKAGTLIYSPASIPVAAERYFRKSLETNGYKSGDYVGIAYAQYGDVATANQSFRIGSLLVNISNFTQRVQQKGIQKFHIDIESFWNREVEGIFAEVNLSREGQEVSFRTPPLDLKPWERKTLEGYLDTNGLEGKYRTDILLYYAQKTAFSEGFTIIYRYGYKMLTLASLAIALIAGLIIALVVFMRRKKMRRK